MNIIKRFLTSKSGAVAIITAVSMLIMIAIVGGAIDFGRQALARQRLQMAIDTAATSAAAQEVGNNASANAIRTTVAQSYYNLNAEKSFFGQDAPQPTIVAGASDIAISVNGTIPTQFLSVIQMPTLTLKGASKVTYDALPATDFDVLIMVDETGSTESKMTGSSFSRNYVQIMAINDFINQIFPPDAPPRPNIRMGLLGYSSRPSSLWGMSSKRSEVMSYIDHLFPRCKNYDHIAMYAAKRLITGDTDGALGRYAKNDQGILSPEFCGFNEKPLKLPSPTTQRDAPGDPKYPNASPSRNLIFISDGAIMLEPTTAEAPPCPEGGAELGFSIRRCYSTLVTACDDIKKTNTRIFTVVFGDPPNQKEENALKACASIDPATGKPLYEYASAEGALKEFLVNAAKKISKVRIVE